MTPLDVALTLWSMGFLPEEELVSWVDAQILASDRPAAELLEISLQGIASYLKRPASEFPARPLELSFVEEFSLRAVLLDSTAELEVAQFVEWTTRRCMGEELEQPEVRLGYLLDHLWWDCNDRAGAIRLLGEQLPSLMPRCHTSASQLLACVSDISPRFRK